MRDLARGGPQQQRRGAVRDAIENARLLLVSARGRWFGGNTSAQRFTLLLSDAEGALRALLALREALDDAAPAEAPQPALNVLADRMDAIAAALSEANPSPSSRRRPRQETKPPPPLYAPQQAGSTPPERHLERPAEQAAPANDQRRGPAGRLVAPDSATTSPPDRCHCAMPRALP